MASRPSDGMLAQLAAEFERLKQIWASQPPTPDAQSSKDHRTEDRFPVFARGTCMCSPMKAPEPITVYNISLRGVQFRIRQRLELGAQIVVVVYMPGAQAFEEIMRVRWISNGEDQDTLRVGASLIERLPAM